MKEIPKEYKGLGIFIRCLKCKRQGKSDCKATGESFSKCPFEEVHRYELVVHVGKDQRRQKLLQTRNFKEVLAEREKFRREVIAVKDGLINSSSEFERENISISEYIVEYLDSLDGKNPFEHLNIKVVKGHRANIFTVLKRFALAMRESKFDVTSLTPKEFTDKHVDAFNRYIKQLNNSQTTYNAHFVCMKTFFNWLINVKNLKINNPFKHAKLTFDKNKVVRIITQEEFSNLLKVATPEKGYMSFKNKNAKGKGKNMFREYLALAWRLAIETGCRREELVELRWNQLQTLPDGVECFYVSNLKVNRIKTGLSHGKYMRPIPVTSSLKKLLLELGYNKMKGKNEFVLKRPAGISAMKFAENISRGFNHYISFVNTGGRKIEFMDLRKTYITFLTLALGEKARIFTGHSNDDILKDSYLAKEYISGDLKNFEVFGKKKKPKTS